MKKLKRLFGFSLIMTMLCSLISPMWVRAEEYTYQISIIRGGTEEIGAGFVSDMSDSLTIVSASDEVSVSSNKDSVIIKGLKYNDQISFNPKSAVEIPDDSNDKYYVKGMRISGSNDVVSESTFSVTKDNSYVVAYGVGAVVPYTVKYLDGAGNALAQQNTFYGAIGDEVYVPYKYIDGYIPNALNLHTASLKENDEFVFTYTKASASGGQTIYNTTTSTSYGVVEGEGQMTYQFVPAAVREVAGQGQAGGAANGNGTNQAGGAAGGNQNNEAANGNNEVAIEDTQTPTTADVVDIDDEDVAKAGETEKMFDTLERTAMVIAILGVLLILLTIGATIKEKHDISKYD
ncbi:MucBP domain-containing protein [Pseudobutyrivibrio sp. LB2011]|uniref:MucBP domain-containing protein n=1 Tax=Pseudobutyrivibrio sp. LB2011 TaxID=1408312 RepID=UPI0005D253BC|nr:MucBP domain-containing protein [Pseudobutyrivibrio sp. LB2011]